MSDESSTGRAGSGAPSEEELREYLSQLRSVPADRVLLDVLNSALTAAQAKLGRRDARLMIDVGALVLGHAGQYLTEDTAAQLEQVLGQLRLAQVQAEQAVAANADEEPHDLPSMPAPPAQGEASAAAAQPQEPRPASKLWVPGR